MTINIEDYKGRRLHFIGIGGCSMNGLAEIMHSNGYIVTGSDKVESGYTKRLRDMHLEIHIGHDAANVGDADLVVYSAAIKDTNPEMQAAADKGIPRIDRATLLGLITKQFSEVIGVAGCHGKTTITSMLALIFKHNNLNATMHVGGEVPFLSGGTHIGNRDIFLTEACEYVESFLKLKVTAAILNNIDDDHLDYFKDIDHIYSAFEKYVALLPENGLLCACIDDPLVAKLAASTKCRIDTYGLSSPEAAWTASNITYGEFGNPSFDCVHNGEVVCRVDLIVPGRHNIINALAAISLSHAFGIEAAHSAEALKDYTLAKRRFEFYGEKNGVKLFHDYAHHPSEITACLDAASRYPHNRIWCIFQCNSFSRAKTLFDKYATAFTHADFVLVPDIYPGREVDTGIIHATDLVRVISSSGTNCKYLPTFEDIKKHVSANAKSGDIVVAVGSGDVFKKVRILLD
ncbi:MAG: UDP-N-acetylmuramate--L-alanine ligase [Christensenellales bacterium]|jgi:UDP-N-acetylmuramate--alanine ligase